MSCLIRLSSFCVCLSRPPHVTSHDDLLFDLDARWITEQLDQVTDEVAGFKDDRDNDIVSADIEALTPKKCDVTAAAATTAVSGRKRESLRKASANIAAIMTSPQPQEPRKDPTPIKQALNEKSSPRRRSTLDVTTTSATDDVKLCNGDVPPVALTTTDDDNDDVDDDETGDDDEKQDVLPTSSLRKRSLQRKRSSCSKVCICAQCTYTIHTPTDSHGPTCIRNRGVDTCGVATCLYLLVTCPCVYVTLSCTCS